MPAQGFRSVKRQGSAACWVRTLSSEIGFPALKAGWSHCSEGLPPLGKSCLVRAEAPTLHPAGGN